MDSGKKTYTLGYIFNFDEIVSHRRHKAQGKAAEAAGLCYLLVRIGLCQYLYRGCGCLLRALVTDGFE